MTKAALREVRALKQCLEYLAALALRIGLPTCANLIAAAACDAGDAIAKEDAKALPEGDRFNDGVYRKTERSRGTLN